MKERDKLLKKLNKVKKKLGIIGGGWGRFCTDLKLEIVIKELEDRLNEKENF